MIPELYIMNPNCLFCKIITQQIPAYIVYENDHVVAVLDSNPSARGHTMVVPRVHAENILDVPDNETQPLFTAVKKVIVLLQQKLNPDGFTIGINHGKAGGQAIDHLHIHIIPRWHNDNGGSLHTIVHNPSTEPLEKTYQKLTSEIDEK